MDTIRAFCLGEANRGREMMVFDWDQAAKIIKEKQPVVASAGLSGDWEYTGGEIYRDGKPVNNEYTFLSSTWATPELCVDGEYIDCFRMAHEVPAEWGADLAGTKWPASAIAILNAQ